jgi:hypothetical protein
MIEIKFNEMFPNRLLFSGQINGLRDQPYIFPHDITYPSKLLLSCATNQVITSSYFAGILKEYALSFNSIDEVFKHIDLDELTGYSRKELMDAIEYIYIQNH